MANSTPQTWGPGKALLRGPLLLAHAVATHGGAVARERRDRPGVAEARPVPVARARADGPVRPRVHAGTNAVTGPGAHVPLGVAAGCEPVATVLGDGRLVGETGVLVHAAVLSNAAVIREARINPLAGVLR